MDDYSINYPMRPPLLESTAVIAEERNDKTSPSYRSDEPRAQVANDELRDEEDVSGRSHELVSSFEHSSSLSEESIKFQSEEDLESGSSTSLLDKETHSIVGQIPVSTATEQLCQSTSTLHSSAPTHSSKKDINFADSATVKDNNLLSSPEAASRMQSFSFNGEDREGEHRLYEDCLDQAPSAQSGPSPGLSCRPKASDQLPPTVLDLSRKPPLKSSIQDCTSTFTVSSLDISVGNASPVQKNSSGQPIPASSPAKGAILRFRLDPVTNKFVEVVPAVSKVKVYETSCSNLLSQSKSKSSEKTVSPWEMWLVRKIQLDLEKQQLFKAEMVKKEKEEAKVREGRWEKLQQAAVVHKEWVQKKDAEQRIRRRVQKEEVRKQQEALSQKRQISHAKASASYIEWKKRKEEAEERLKEKMKEQAKIKEQQQREVHERASHAYKVWLRTVGCKKIDRELLYPDTKRDFMFSSVNKNKLGKWHFY